MSNKWPWERRSIRASTELDTISDAPAHGSVSAGRITDLDSMPQEP